MKELLTVISSVEELSNKLSENLSKNLDKLIDKYDLSLDVFLNMTEILMSAGVIKTTLKSIVELYKNNNG